MPVQPAGDLATVDVPSGGRLEPGVGAEPPVHGDDVRGALHPDTAERLGPLPGWSPPRPRPPGPA